MDIMTVSLIILGVLVYVYICLPIVYAAKKNYKISKSIEFNEGRIYELEADNRNLKEENERMVEMYFETKYNMIKNNTEFKNKQQ